RTPFKTSDSNFLFKALAYISLAPIVTVRNGFPFSVLTPTLPNKVNGQTLDSNLAMPFLASRDDNRGPMYASTDLRFTKAFFINRERDVHLDFTAEGSNIFNRVNFNRVNDQFFTTNGLVTMPNGN